MDQNIAALILEAVRVLFIAAVPIILAVAVAGMIAGTFQAATTISDYALGYAARVGAVVAILYLFYPAVSEAIRTLAQRAFG